jgi:alpha-L-rhamnosidase
MNENGQVMGIDVPNPRFFWQLPLFEERGITQKAYQIIVREFFSSKTIWNTKIVNSSECTHITYSGKPLKSDTHYSWSLKLWFSNGEVSDVAFARFHTGLFNPKDDFQGIWIGSKRISMNEVRKEFTLPNLAIQSATAFISGIGYYELYINGINVDITRKLDPGWTTYQVRVLYSTFDVTALLTQNSNNAIGILLGNGWYSQDQNIPPSMPQPTYGPPRVILQLNIQFGDGSNTSIVTDGTWTGRSGSILRDSIYQGERVDGRLIRNDWAKPNFNDPNSLWIPVDNMPSPVLSNDGICSCQHL